MWLSRIQLEEKSVLKYNVRQLFSPVLTRKLSSTMQKIKFGSGQNLVTCSGKFEGILQIIGRDANIEKLQGIIVCKFAWNRNNIPFDCKKD